MSKRAFSWIYYAHNTGTDVVEEQYRLWLRRWHAQAMFGGLLGYGGDGGGGDGDDEDDLREKRGRIVVKERKK